MDCKCEIFMRLNNIQDYIEGWLLKGNINNNKIKKKHNKSAKIYKNILKTFL